MQSKPLQRRPVQQQQKRPLAAQPRHAAAGGTAAVTPTAARAAGGRIVQTAAQLPPQLHASNDATRVISYWAHAAGIRAQQVEVCWSPGADRTHMRPDGQSVMFLFRQ
jgi:hypothetical protein